jgi:hypothetical protein
MQQKKIRSFQQGFRQANEVYRNKCLLHGLQSNSNLPTQNFQKNTAKNIAQAHGVLLVISF